MNENLGNIDRESREISQYETIPFTNSMFPIRINRDSEMTVASGYSPITWHEQLEILVFLDGNGVCLCDGERLPCQAGDIIVINTCESHAVEYTGGRLRYHCLMIDPGLCTGRDEICHIRYIGKVINRQVRFRHRVGDNPVIRRILDDILAESLEVSVGYEMAVKGDILKLFAELFRRETDDDSRSGNRTADFEQLVPALRYITEHYAEDIALDDLAGSCCLNPSYFCRRFHALTGRTAVTYLNEYRLAKARALLMTTSESVSAIARSVGFSDSGYFTRRYRSVFGTSPIQARKAARDGRHD